MHLCMSFVDVLKTETFLNVRDIFVFKKNVNDIFYKFVFYQSFRKFIIRDILKRIIYRTRLFDDDFRDFFELIKIIIFFDDSSDEFFNTFLFIVFFYY